MAGKVVILITKDTPDEGYYWAAKKREKLMRSELEFLRSKINNELNDIKQLKNTIGKDNNKQKKLEDYNKKDKILKVIVDHREYRSNVIRNLTIKGVSIEPDQLDVGDFILSSRIGVERKKVDDFLESLINGRLFKQISRLRESYSRPVLILEGDNLLTKRNINHNAIFGSLASINIDFGVPIIPTKNASETADLLYVMAKREQREDKKIVAVRGEKTSMSLNERQQFVLEGLPNISSVLAKRLLNHFSNIRSIVNASEEELTKVNGIGKNISNEIFKLLNANYIEE
jgi:Fanconi anemia group M protein